MREPFDTLLSRCRGPLTFTTPLVPKVRDGSKTRTMRIIHPQPDDVSVGVPVYEGHKAILPRFAPGDLAYVAEGLRCDCDDIVYVADNTIAVPVSGPMEYWHWKPSILSSRFMPKRFARTILGIDDVGAQRVQEISEAEILAEGVRGDCYPELGQPTCSDARSARIYMADLWDSIHRRPPEDWASNPWTRPIAFHVEATR